MDNLPVNFLDALVLLILLISAGFAYMRGFVHEVLAMAGWVGAGFVALYGLPHARGYFRSFISMNLIADIAAGLALFLVSLLIFSLITKAISNRIHSSSLSALDRSLGFLFGLARGGLLVCLAYLSMGWLLTSEDQPDWMKKAKTRPAMEQGVALLQRLLPAELGGAEAATRQAADRAREAIETKRMVDQLTRPQPKSGPGRPEGGYENSERRDLDRLIKNTQ
jgi:membrane protein required for colicin V production